MIKKIIEDISSFLPLVVDSIEWNDPILTFIGNGWSFSTISSWRIVNNNKLICACYDSEAIETLKKIEKGSIVSIMIQSDHLCSDPVFVFSNEYKFEIFSITYLEPWVFGSPTGIVFVASPSDKTCM